ncbi:MAG: UvrD-helicase domain-containing protein [Bacteroidia bacterium]|nr:UvrD-helicase domain-containing protein [Bacteroidia bacterium]
MKILKASAGSGKTWRLTRDYITLLLKDRDRYAYRHILAVTFTNKATAEMKSRILSELSVLSHSPESSDYYAFLVPALFPDAGLLRSRAEDVLVNILHDYGAFAVSTIDSFFQQTLKAFSREIGYFASYQVELDRDSLIREAVDRMLDSITEDDREMLGWLDEDVADTLERGGRVNLADTIFENARNLKSAEHGSLLDEYGLDDAEMFSRGRLRAVRKECTAYIASYESAVRKAAEEVGAALERCGIDPADSNRKFLQTVLAYSRKPDTKTGYVSPSAAVMEKCSDPELWFAKDKAPKLLPQVQGVLDGPLASFRDLFTERYRLYRTAVLLKGRICSLGIAGEFFRNFEALVKEKNVLCIEDSNEILRKIIGGSDAPFVYEKLGVRFEHFLLDEFQDTSRLQWDNFLPLLRESESNSHESLVVGDVKQSIYRWRGSDWELLGSTLQKQFPSSETEVLDSNYRSTLTVVEFNNAFFTFAAAQLGTAVSEEYADVCQKSAVTEENEPQKGFVKVDFTSEDQLEAVLDSVRDAMARGAEPGDIAVLVRNNSSGSDVAAHLIGSGIPVVSDDSLDVKSSLTVRRLVSLLHWVDDPGDEISCYLASCLIPEGAEEEWKMQWHSLTDLCESILRLMEERNPGCTDGQVLFIQSFMDCLQEWTAANGQNLQAFLEYFDGASPKISSPQDTSSVRVMTIHKSKGLQFPYVIFPFAETVSMSKPATHWCYLGGDDPLLHLPDGSAPLKSAAPAIYPLSLSSTLRSTAFCKDYEEDRRRKEMDCINLFYVALTRAAKSLHIIAKQPSAKLREAATLPEYSDISQLLYLHLRERLDKDGSCSFGDVYDFTRMKRKVRNENSCDSAYPSYPLEGRLAFPEDASDFFGSDGLAGAKSSRRINGIVLHGILAAVRSPQDLRAAVDEAVREGRLESEDAERDYAMLASRLASAVERGWFPPDARIISETDIIDSDGSIHRPDRAVVTADGVIIVDYKFGRHADAYERQVARYVQLYRKMGYSHVRGFLWYVYEDEVVEVECRI